jgi:hypothetical protein
MDGEIGRNQANLVISVWFEADHPEPFRARLVSSTGAAGVGVIRYARSREAVLSEVKDWLTDLPEI